MTNKLNLCYIFFGELFDNPARWLTNVLHKVDILLNRVDEYFQRLS
jgi:hypothetical protein